MRSIVTAGHCLCTNKYNEIYNKDLDHRFMITCPENGDHPDIELNNYSNNRLAVAVGTTRIPPPLVPAYDDNIKAFLYEYEDSGGPGGFSINGDVGIIVHRYGLDAVSKNEHRHGPICLPTKSFRSRIAVKTVGWGKLFDAKGTNDISTTRTSCQTNEGRTHDDISTPSPYDQRLKFLDCVVYGTRQPTYPHVKFSPFCNSWLLDKGIMTLASTIDLPDVTNIREPTDTPRPFTVSLLKNIPEQTQCENYMKNAKIAFGSEDFDAKVDRIVIKGPHGTNVKRICYNLPKIAKYGVCMTKHPDPLNIGAFIPAATLVGKMWMG